VGEYRSAVREAAESADGQRGRGSTGLPELTFLDQIEQIAVRCGNDSNVDMRGRRLGTDAADLAGLEKP
jgi:hypothetical protein